MELLERVPAGLLGGAQAQAAGAKRTRQTATDGNSRRKPLKLLDEFASIPQP